ncbi:HpcH/HpaI aldolase/citrate lyase domain [Dillenia turbinata]|uniref:HpcH/HpaI aldolase/citrate lyase domain n=1 Tax=Dillenia turbinata TaxID=194707 RepID=A0AAN8ZV47_9MAGN
MATLTFLASSPSAKPTLPTLTEPILSLLSSKSRSLPFSLPKTSTLTLTQTQRLPPLKSSSSTPDDLSPITQICAPITLKSRLHNGDTLYGLFLLSFSPTIAEIAGLVGYDFVVIDMEHGPGSFSDALPCLRALAATNTPAILRLPESSPVWAKKGLDLGPQGIMFPMIESAKEARKAVSYCRFPPRGIRGSAHTVVRASNYGMDAGYLSNYEDELLIMCQVESEQAIEKIDEIAAVDGVDCIQMGPLDLSASMGYLWDPGNKKVREMMRKAEKGVLESRRNGEGEGGGAFLAGFAMPHDLPDDLRTRGYHMVSGAVDVALLRNTFVEDVNKFKMGSMNGSDADNNDGDEEYWSE